MRKKADMFTDDQWEKWGQKNPYYGVVSFDEFRGDLDEEALQKFFAMGEYEIARVFEDCQRWLGPEFEPESAFDFGCGTGRLVIPLARRCSKVVGADISESMLKLARENCEREGLEGVELVKSDDELSKVQGPFDLVHSFIVLQHIDPKRGLRVFQRMLDLLKEGGVGVVHFTYSREAYINNIGLATTPPIHKRIRAKLVRLARRLDLFPQKDPETQMNAYHLNQLFFILQKKGVEDFHVRFTNHDTDLGVILYFRK